MTHQPRTLAPMSADVSPWRAVRRFAWWATVHPRLVDVLLAGGIGALSLVGLDTVEAVGTERPPDLLAVLIVLAQTLAFVFRRTRPLTSMVVVVALMAVFWVANYPTGFAAFSLLAVYSATAHGGDDRRRVWSVVGAVVATVTAVSIAGFIVPTEDLPAPVVAANTVVHLTAAVIGEVVHGRRRRLVELEERAALAEAERELLVRQAALDERARIARDLHDVVAHGMSMMVVQAGAAERMLAHHPDRAAEALTHIQSVGRDALVEMRRLLGVLRGADQPGGPRLAPQPTMADLPAVVQRCVEAGVPTELTIDGTRPERAVGQEMAAFRIAQEALTNVIKHAGRPARAAVRVAYTPELLRLEITDDGIGATTGEVAASTGHGMIGMRERVEVYGGTLHAGPRPGGGFRVAATIPLDGAVVPERSAGAASAPPAAWGVR